MTKDAAIEQAVAMRSAEEWAGTYFGINGNNDMELRAAFDTVQQDAIASATDKFEKRRMEFHKFAYSTKAEMDALKDEIVSLRLAASATAERFALENATYYAACPKCPPLELGHVPQVQRVNLGEMPAKFKCCICKCKYTMGVAEDSATGAGDIEGLQNLIPKPKQCEAWEDFCINILARGRYLYQRENGMEESIVDCDTEEFLLEISGPTIREAIAAARGRIGAG